MDLRSPSPGVTHLMVAILCLLGMGAQDNPLKNRHAAILARVLSYELTLEERAGDSLGIAIVYDASNPGSIANADDWFRAFQDLVFVNVKGRPLVIDKVPYSPGDLSAAIDRGADMLLVTDGLGAETSDIARIARARRVLTAGDSPDYVQTDLTVCVSQEYDKTRITINLKAADLERIRFSSRLLALATIIR